MRLKQNLYAWLFEGGMVGVPKRLLGLMGPLGMNFEDLGKVIYLLYCGETGFEENDEFALEAVRTLEGKKLVRWQRGEGRVDFSPMFERIAEGLGVERVDKAEETADTDGKRMQYGEFLKRLEREMGKFLTMKEKEEIQRAVQNYEW